MMMMDLAATVQETPLVEELSRPRPNKWLSVDPAMTSRWRTETTAFWKSVYLTFLGKLHGIAVELNNASMVFAISEMPSNMTLSKYVKRLIKYFQCGKSTLRLAAHLIRRLPEKFQCTELTSFKLILVCLYCAVKFIEDEHYKTRFYAEIGGIDANELVMLEGVYLEQTGFVIDWKPALARLSPDDDEDTLTFTMMTQCFFGN